MTEEYLLPTDEDIEEFGEEAIATAWANKCWLYQDRCDLEDITG